MMRLCSLLVCLVAAAPAGAHFLWVLPADADAQTIRVVFSDAPVRDNPDLLKKVSHAQLTWRGPDAPDATAKLAIGKEALEAELPGSGLREVAVTCRYGVVQRGKSEPFLLHYYAKGFAGLNVDGALPELLVQRWEKVLPLEVLPTKEKRIIQVLWQGKPLADAEVVLSVPGKDMAIEGKTDAEGRFTLVEPTATGTYGVRVRHIEAKTGELDGKAYKEVRHYATVAVRVDRVAGAGAGGESPKRKETQRDEVKPTANPEATRLLAEARAARATYADFPGLTADVDINFDGKVSRAHATVSATGKVKLEMVAGGALSEMEAQAWASRMLSSIIGHRLDSGDRDTPCAFADDVTDHPLGRAIRVLDDEFHSSYRIRDRQVIVVNRRARETRFTITVLENRRTDDGKCLPVSYVVDTWGLKNDALVRSEAHHQTWQRVGSYDLPRTALVVTASSGKHEARSLTLSGCKLLGKEGAR